MPLLPNFIVSCAKKKRGRVVNQSGHGFRSEEIEALLVPSFTIVALVVTSLIIHYKVIQFIGVQRSYW